jgi:hypothetical protein
MLIVCGFQMPIDRYVAETLLVELTVAVPAGVEGLRRFVAFASALRPSESLGVAS